MLIVQKFGGTSVGGNGNDVVVIVSAMAGDTNKLLEYAAHFTKTPPQREVDLLVSSGERVTSALLSIALQSKGIEAIALTGRQAGIVTTNDHMKARIMDIDPEKMQKQLLFMMRMKRN